MVEEQLRARDIVDRRVLEAMERVPRELFVPEELRMRAYEDAALPIGAGQTISQPYMVALICQEAAVRPGQRVLDVGTGSGYQAAVLSRLAEKVVSVERVGTLAERSRRILRQLGYANVHVHEAQDVLGWPDEAPYDGIVVAAAAPSVPTSLVDQLSDGGRLVIPVGPPFDQNLVRVTKSSTGNQVSWLGPCRFVHLIGEEGWPNDEIPPEPAP
jgi:protein-L-isoaspartate(D-aspartate) O-methyltransferase